MTPAATKADDAKMRLRRRAAADATRLRIVELVDTRGRCTAKEIAEALGLGTNGLYYHLRILEEAALIRVVDKQAAGRMVERVYGPAEFQRTTWDPKEPLEWSMHLAAILEAAKARGEQAIMDFARRSEEGAELPVLNYGHQAFDTTSEDVRELNDQVRALLERYRKRAARHKNATTRVRFTFLLHEEPASKDA